MRGRNARSARNQEVVISCGYLAEVLKAYVAANRLPLRVRIAVEDEPLGRGGGLKHAARQLPYPEERSVGLNGDILTRFSLRNLAGSRVERSASAMVAVAPLKSPYGVVELSGDRVTRFAEAPVLPHWINAGVYLFEPEITDLLPDLGDHEDTTFPALTQQPPADGLPHQRLLARRGQRQRPQDRVRGDHRVRLALHERSRITGGQSSCLRTAPPHGTLHTASGRTGLPEPREGQHTTDHSRWPRHTTSDRRAPGRAVRHPARRTDRGVRSGLRPRITSLPRCSP